MSVEFYLACDDCKKKIWIASDGFSGFKFWGKTDETFPLLKSFFAEHVFLPDHKFCLIKEQSDKCEEYIDWETK